MIGNMKKGIIITWIVIIGIYVGNFFLVKNYLDVPAEDQCIFGHDLQKYILMNLTFSAIALLVVGALITYSIWFLFKEDKGGK